MNVQRKLYKPCNSKVLSASTPNKIKTKKQISCVEVAVVVAVVLLSCTMYESSTGQLKMWTTKLPTKVILFILVKAWIEPAILFGWTDSRRILHKCVTDSSKQQFSGFQFRVFPSPKQVALSKLKSSVYPTIFIHSWKEKRRIQVH